MAEKNYTLSYISELKGCSVEELCQFAQEKGIELPADPDYSVSSSKLSAIDPQLAFNLKYGKVVSASKDKANGDSKEKMSIVPPEVYHLPKEKKDPKLNVIGKIDLSTLDQSSRPKIKSKENKTKNNIDNKQKNPKRIIGLIKFFDSMKGWGFIVSGNKGISGKPEDEGRLFSIHLTSSEWNGSTSPKDGDWVIFTPRKTPKGWSASNAERMEYNRENLLFSMNYRGKYAKISGSDGKGDRFDKNILCHIIKKMTMTKSVVVNSPYRHMAVTYDTTRFTEIIDTFCEYLVDMPKERQASTIKQFLDDTELNNLLFKVFTEGEYSSEDSLRLSAHQLFSEMLLEHIFESGKLADLSKLPESFDYTQHVNQLTNILVNEALTDSDSNVEKWLGEHDVYEKLELDDSAPNTIPLRLILKDLTGNKSWIEDLNAEWSDIKSL